MDLALAVLGISEVIQALGQELLDLHRARAAVIEKLEAIPEVEQRLRPGWEGDLGAPDADFAERLGGLASALKVLGADLAEYGHERAEGQAASAPSS